MEKVLLVVHLLVAIALVLTILAQRTAQDGGGLMGGGSTMGGLFTARGSANLLTRTTAILATIFIITSLALGVLASAHHRVKSVTDTLVETAPPASAPAVPASAPETPKGKKDKAPEAPARSEGAPAAPRVPVSK